MEYQSAEVLHDKDGKTTRIEVTECNRARIDVKDVLEPVAGSQRNTEETNTGKWNHGEIISRRSPLGDVDNTGDVNMEATITPDDVIKAGGFGARDDISSFLPVASDATDFEASISDAQDYEQPQEEVRRPGLGWKEASEKV